MLTLRKSQNIIDLYKTYSGIPNHLATNQHSKLDRLVWDIFACPLQYK